MNTSSFHQHRPQSATGCRILIAVMAASCLFFLVLAPQAAFSETRVLRIVNPWEITSADLAKSGYLYLRMQILETLVSVDRQGNTMPGLSTAWTTSADGLEWRMTLREGVRFHNGALMTPESVVNALNISLKKPGMLGKAPVQQIAHQGNAVIIGLTEPYAILDSVLSHYTTSILAPSAYGKKGNVKELIATGPYKIASINPPQGFQTVAFSGYWGQQPKIRAASYLAVARNETRALMAQSGDADIIFTIDPTTLKRLERSKGIATYSASLPRTIAIKVNCALAGLDSAPLRKALSDGLDRKGISLTVMRMDNAAAHQLFPESLGHWHIDGLNTPANPSTNYKKLMMAKGWKENQEGYLEKRGKPLEFTLVTYADRLELPVAATAIQDQMRKMGIKLNISVTNPSAIPQGHKQGTLEMGLIARNYGLISNPLGTVLQDYSQGGGWGAMNWESEAMQNLLAKLKTTTEPGLQKEYIRLTSRLLSQEMPTIPVVSYLHTAVTSKQILNFSLDPLERSYRITDLEWSDRK